jgi:hypothetical protein
MQWYVYLITMSATVVLGWFAFELLGRPIRAFFGLRRKVLEQLLVLGNISLPKPRETVASSREIQEYNQAVRNVREAQRVFSDLGSQLLALGENEPAARNTLAATGLNLVAAGGGLIGLSAAYSRPDTDRAALRNQIEKALRLTDAAPATSRSMPTKGSLNRTARILPRGNLGKTAAFRGALHPRSFRRPSRMAEGENLEKTLLEFDPGCSRWREKIAAPAEHLGISRSGR